jgi:uncharacterized membrane protein YqiK
MQVRLELLRQLPSILEKTLKPMEKIDSIRLFQVNGMPAGSIGMGDGAAGGAGGSLSLPDQVVDSALKYQIAQPLVAAIMKDAGLGSGSLSSISQAVAAMAVTEAPVPTLPQ